MPPYYQLISEHVVKEPATGYPHQGRGSLMNLSLRAIRDGLHGFLNAG